MTTNDLQRRRASFRQRDLLRALNAAKVVGLDVVRVEVDLSGKISIIVKKGSDESPTVTLDAWLAANARSS